MNRLLSEIIHQSHVSSHGTRRLLVGCIVFACALLQVKVMQAQTLPLAISTQTDTLAIVSLPALSEARFADHMTDHTETDDHIESDEATIDATAAARPPLPFREPQVGPLVKRVSMDDIARRTTAFIPQTELLNLTSVEAPEEEKWIHVDLSEQLVVAYQDGQAVRAFIISSGLPGTPTVTGEFRIRTKVSEQTMFGGVGSNAYNLPGVKWVQYFFEDYSFHGTYWHSNFGSPMSHGCINMTDRDAKWLFDWAGPVWDNETVWYKSSTDNPGTLVLVTE